MSSKGAKLPRLKGPAQGVKVCKNTMKTFKDAESKVWTNDNDVLFIRGSIGVISFSSDKYMASFYEGEWHYEVEDEDFDHAVTMLKGRVAARHLEDVREESMRNFRRHGGLDGRIRR